VVMLFSIRLPSTRASISLSRMSMVESSLLINAKKLLSSCRADYKLESKTIQRFLQVAFGHFSLPP
jgi:hypothetical protein